MLTEEETSEASTGERLVVRWNGVAAAAGQLSLPALVEAHGLELREEILDWLAALGRAEIGGVRLPEWFSTAPEISAWWLTPLAEKSPMRSPVLFSLFKLRALEKLYVRHGCTGIAYAGRDGALAATLKAWMSQLGHAWSHLPVGEPVRRKPRWLHAMRAWGVLLLRILPQWIRLRRGTPLSWDAASVTAVSYFPGFDEQRAAAGEYRSTYWRGFHDVLASSGLQANWILICPGYRHLDLKKLAAQRDRLNAAQDRPRLAFVEQFAGMRDIARSIAFYLRMRRAARHLDRSIAAHFMLPGSRLNFFELLADEWNDAVRGASAMQAAWWLAVFMRLARALPRGGTLYYPWENQTWEAGLLQAVRAAGGGMVIGHQHTVPAPLHLRFATPDPASAERASILPDVLAVNGPKPAEMLAQLRFPRSRMREVEALRYMHLHDSQARPNGNEVDLLIVGGFLSAETRFLLELLDEAIEDGAASGFRRIQVKPHPDFPLERLWRQSAKVKTSIASAPLPALLPTAKVVVVANSTAAAIDAVHAGKPTIVCAAGDALNLSYFYGDRRITFVDNAKALADALRQPPRVEGDIVGLRLDPAMPGWYSLVNAARPARPR
jgi:surface carbohydrate biosynthesis protein (TIGR04326 family)